MDLRMYYQKIREATTGIADPYPVMVSFETQDGGKAGVLTEVPKALAAKMLVDARARLATPEEAEAFHAKQAEDKRLADKLAEVGKFHISVVSPEEMNILRELSPSKG